MFIAIEKYFLFIFDEMYFQKHKQVFFCLLLSTAVMSLTILQTWSPWTWTPTYMVIIFLCSPT